MMLQLIGVSDAIKTNGINGCVSKRKCAICLFCVLILEAYMIHLAAYAIRR